MSQDLHVPDTIDISPSIPTQFQVVQISYHAPRLAVVLLDPASGNQDILLADQGAGTQQFIAQGLQEVTVTINDNSVVWSQRGWRSATHLYYWRTGFPQGGRLLFTPQQGFDLNFPQLVGGSVVFVQGWPIAAPQTGRRLTRKTAVLIYDLNNIPLGDPSVDEISDEGIWDNSKALHGVFHDPVGGDTLVAYYRQPPSTSSLHIPHLVLTVLP